MAVNHILLYSICRTVTNQSPIKITDSSCKIARNIRSETFVRAKSCEVAREREAETVKSR